MSNLPAVRQQQSLAVPDDEMSRLMAQAEAAIKTGLLPNGIDTPQKAVIVMLQGRELGVGSQASLNNIYPIQGNTMLSARLTEALLKRAGYRIIPLSVTAEAARGKFISPQGDEFVYEVTYEEAVAGGWTVQWSSKKGAYIDKPAWKNRKVMLWNRCVTQGAKMFAADALLFPPVDEDDSMMVYDAEDEEYVTAEEAAHRVELRERDRAPLITPRRARGRLFKTEGPQNGNNHSEPEPTDAEFREAEPEPPAPQPAPTGNGSNWTKIKAERDALGAFLAKHDLSPDDAKRILGDWLHRGPLELFSEFPHDRQRAQRVLLGWLMCHRETDPETHWMKTEPKAKARFWATMGSQGMDTEAVHERVPRTGTFPGDVDELIDFVLYSRPEDRWQPALPGMGEEVPY